MKPFFLVTIILAVLPPVFPQGSLTPPAAPTPTMKSLDQIASQGIAINAANTPGDANYEAVISTAGNYYLTGNLHVAKTNGIHVTVAGVTVDLNGFQIDRTSGSGGDGITVDGTADRCLIKNGSIVGFAIGADSSFSGPTVPRGGSFVQLTVSGCSSIALLARTFWQIESCVVHDNPGSGIVAVGLVSNCTASKNTKDGFDIENSSTVANCLATGNRNGFILGSGCVLNNCSASGNSLSGIIAVSDNCSLINCAAANNQTGILTGNGCTLTNCSAYLNTNFGSGSAAINVGSNCSLTGCVASNNHADYGILTGIACTLMNCSASGNNQTTGAPSGGIKVDNNCSLSNCVASDSTAMGTHNATTGVGFALGSNCVMQGCSASNNVGDGISFVGNCLITGNNATGNGFNGFHVTGSINRIDGNLAVGNGAAGILWANDFVVRNTSFVNTPNYSPPVGGGNTGPVQAASSATNPWANF